MKRKLSYNIIFSLLLQIVAVANSFITSKIIITYFGSEINGLIASVNQFLNYISLLEGGVGAVVMAHLYKPIYENDTNKISKIIEASRRFFRQIIYVYLVYTLVLSILYPLIVKPMMDIKLVILLVWILSISLCAQYFFAISYKILLQANHRLYICSIIQIIAYILNICFVIFASIQFKNIIIVKIFSSMSFLLQPLLITIFTDKKYRKTSDKLNYTLKGRWDGFFQNLAFFINNNTDIVLITLFVNLKEVSVYSIYMLVVNGMKSVILAVSTGFQSLLGRELASCDLERIKLFMRRYFAIILLGSLAGFGTVILMIRQFVLVYIGNIGDYSYDRVLFPLVIAISQMIICIREPLNLLIVSANKFRETNIGAVIEVILNIIISLLLVKEYGMLGVAIGTLIASLYRLLYFICYLRKNIINLNYKVAIRPMLLITVYVTFISIYYLKFEHFSCRSWGSFIKSGIIYTGMSIILTFILVVIIFPKDIQKLRKLCANKMLKTRYAIKRGKERDKSSK